MTSGIKQKSFHVKFRSLQLISKPSEAQPVAGRVRRGAASAMVAFLEAAEAKVQMQRVVVAGQRPAMGVVAGMLEEEWVAEAAWAMGAQLAAIAIVSMQASSRSTKR